MLSKTLVRLSVLGGGGVALTFALAAEPPQPEIALKPNPSRH